MTNSTEDLAAENIRILFYAKTDLDKEVSVRLKTIEPGVLDLHLPYGLPEGTLGRALEMLAKEGLYADLREAESWLTGTYYPVKPFPVNSDKASTLAPTPLPSTVQMLRTGKKVSFLELDIGRVFYFEDAFWIRTGTYVGTDLRPRGKGLEHSPHGTTYGSCSFGTQPDTLEVEEVALVFHSA